MENLIENLVVRLEQKKEKIENFVLKDNESNDNTLTLMSAGQIIAYDYCIKELKRLIEFSNLNKLKSDSLKNKEHERYLF